MSKVIIISGDDPLDEVLSHPLTASVFVYLRLSDQPVGVREVQRSLNFGSPSTAHGHLKKLHDKGMVEQLQGNRYRLLEPYATVKKIPLKVTLNHYFVGGKVVPGVLLLVTFLVTSSVAVLVLILTESWPQAAFTGFLGLIVTAILITKFYLDFKEPARPDDSD
ncbi:MAG: hypothetical protein ACFFD4_34580 [Candidatus Odinarchaeota archaeon]